MWEYTDAVYDHFLNPRNAGPLPDANAVGEVGSLACGDALKLYLKIDASERITDAGFETFGCASAIASSSVLTQMLKGMSVADAQKITNRDIVAKLGGLPAEKMHCSVMGQEALEAALRAWRGEPPLLHGEDDGPLVCNCFGVSEGLIRRTVRENGLRAVEEIRNFTKAGGGCGDCSAALEAIIVSEQGVKPLEELKISRLTNVRRIRLISRALDEEIRPRLIQDGGDVELVDGEGPLVTVALRGKCGNCRSSRLTLKNVVEKALREHVSPDIVVQDAV
ncbi:MAG: Fe-S cluster assembly protein NifU [Deltaproteobacteria bacterium]|jgi:NifU-like protein|nr:Fe-S cluster assembly protein NifU [Deltaproteobacteria bacterium]